MARPEITQGDRRGLLPIRDCAGDGRRLGKASAKAPETPVQKLKPLAGTSEPATPQATPATRAYVTCVNV